MLATGFGPATPLLEAGRRSPADGRASPGRWSRRDPWLLPVIGAVADVADQELRKPELPRVGLSLITAAIVHWNTIYLDRAVRQLPRAGSDGSRTICWPMSHHSDGSISA